MNHLCSSLHWRSVNREHYTDPMTCSQTSEHSSKGHEVELIHENMNIILLIFVLNPSYFRIPIYRSSRFIIWSPSHQQRGSLIQKAASSALLVF